MAEPRLPLPVPELEVLLRGQTPDELLTLFAHLTHKIHAFEVEHGRKPGAVDLRAQRLIVKTEILRRCDRL